MVKFVPAGATALSLTLALAVTAAAGDVQNTNAHRARPKVRRAIERSRRNIRNRFQLETGFFGVPSPAQPAVPGEAGRLGLECVLTIGSEERNGPMPTMEEQVLRTTKEIVVKFIETGRVSPTSFPEAFKTIHETVKSVVEEKPAADTEPQDEQ